MKEQIYAELVSKGTPLGLRKCKEAPRVSPRDCPHPAPALMGAGNQVQREIWCKDCHSRWMVDPTVMSQIQSKAPVIQFNGKVYNMHQTVGLPNGPMKMRPSAKHSPRSPDVRLKTPMERRLQTPTPRSVATNEATPVRTPCKPRESEAPICKCGKPCTQLIVKKEGPTQGRLFWKCTERLCNFFEWDQEETKLLQRRALQEKEDEEMRKAEQEAAEEREWMVQRTMAAAEERHAALMQEEKMRHQGEMEQMKNQLFWLTAVAGEDRMAEIFQNPLLQQQTMLRAMELRKQMVEEEMQAAQNDPGMSSSGM